MDGMCTTECHFCFGPASSFFLKLFLCPSPLTYWTLSNLGVWGGGVHLPGSVISLFLSYCLWSSQGKTVEVVFPFPSPVDHWAKQVLLTGQKSGYQQGCIPLSISLSFFHLLEFFDSQSLPLSSKLPVSPLFDHSSVVISPSVQKQRKFSNFKDTHDYIGPTQKIQNSPVTRS